MSCLPEAFIARNSAVSSSCASIYFSIVFWGQPTLILILSGWYDSLEWEVKISTCFKFRSFVTGKKDFKSSNTEYLLFESCVIFRTWTNPCPHEMHSSANSIHSIPRGMSLGNKEGCVWERTAKMNKEGWFCISLVLKYLVVIIIGL